MRQTQIEAYKDFKDSGKDVYQREIVYKKIKAFYDSGLTLNEISKYTNIRLSSVTARVNELCKDGRVHDIGTKIDGVTGRNNTAWFAHG